MLGECFLNEILRKLVRIQKLPTGYGQDRQAEVFGQRLNCFAVAPQGRAVYGGNAQWRQGIHQGTSALPADRAQRAFRGRISLFGMTHQNECRGRAGGRFNVVRRSPSGTTCHKHEGVQDKQQHSGLHVTEDADHIALLRSWMESYCRQLLIVEDTIQDKVDRNVVKTRRAAGKEIPDTMILIGLHEVVCMPS